MDKEMDKDEYDYEEMAAVHHNTMLGVSFVPTYYKIMQYAGTLEAVVFGELLRKEYFHKYTAKNLTKDGFFYETIEHMEQKLNLSKHKQSVCIQVLEEKNLIFTDVRKGDNQDSPKRHFKIRHDVLNALLKSIFEDFNYREIPNTCKNETEGSIVKDFNYRLSKISTQVIIKENKNKVSYLAPQDNKAQPSPTFCAVTLHPRKTIIRRTTPLVYIPEPDKPDHQGKKPLTAKKPKPRCLKETPEVLEILDYWRTKKFSRSIPNIDTSSYANLVSDLLSLLAGTLFDRKYSVRDVKTSIDNFALSIFDPDYEPMNIERKISLGRTPIGIFFYNKIRPTDDLKSMFVKYLSKPRLISSNPRFIAKDDLPFVTKRLEDWFRHTFAVVGLDGNFNKNDIIFASRAIKTFYEENKAKMPYITDYYSRVNIHEPVQFLAKYLTQMFDQMLRDNPDLYKKITTSWLKGEKILNEKFPSYLREIGIISTRSGTSIYQR